MTEGSEELAPAWRWTETDPRGLVIRCAAAVWEVKTQRHPEIVAHEGAVRAVLRDPDLVYDDPLSTEHLRPTGGRVAAIRHYIGRGRVSGHPATLITVVVKVLRGPDDSPEIGYVQTTYFTGRIPIRLQLRWSRVL
ncbi:MAG: hypothetical protein M3442_12610 [Chloroflexota bacterium]|nr:hypothetical protein [Chloroflexota bacterium]